MAQSRKAENAKKCRRWKKHLKDWAASDRTQEDYCQAHNLSRHQFQYWKKRLHPPESHAFIEVRVSPENEKQLLAHHATIFVIPQTFPIPCTLSTQLQTQHVLRFTFKN